MPRRPEPAPRPSTIGRRDVLRGAALTAASMVLTSTGAAAATAAPTTVPGWDAAVPWQRVFPARAVALLAGQGADDVNQTRDRFAVHATDLGVMWRDGRGRVAIAFGDTYGPGWGGNGAGPHTADWRCNVLAHASNPSLADGLRIDSMITDRPGHAAQILARDTSVAEETVIPTAGIAVGSRDVLHYMSVRHWGAAGTWVTNYAGLAYSDDGGQTWAKPVNNRWSATGGGARFQLGAFAADGDTVYLFGTPQGRFGDVVLARVATDRLLDPASYQYWTAQGWDRTGLDRTVPVLAGPVGELSVLYNEHLRRWVALYLDESRAAIVARTAPAPNGPWTGGRIVAHGQDFGGLYGAFLHPASTGRELYFAMSQWTPYHVRLMSLSADELPVESNLVQDGGFEDRPPGAGVGPWRVNGRGGVDQGLGYARSGENNGWIRADAGWNDLFQKVAVRPGARHRLTGWVRSSAATDGGYLGVRRPDGGGTIAEAPFGHVADYAPLTVEFTADEAGEAEVFCGGWAGSGGEVWIQLDDVVLEPLD
ncbi:DUF4185 domain-containing protein [Actinoalloteichus fjordicus]|uniref:DUF4185 domain-containing protein n=1 Tax=Actinoalloteichus fjordicus TaxID=1612552 RepID=UPI002989C40A|nr:DUF4185 domain-containing protein [Actinoalloteichus fjordicus]